MASAARRLKRTLLIACLWTACLWNPCRCDGPTTECDIAESYDEMVTVSVKEPVHVTKYKWCLDIPPRCPENKQEFRTVYKNITVSKIRTVKKCCEGHIRLYDRCVPNCTEDQCSNIQCAPDTNECNCKPGYIGHLCKQTCDVGRWGPGCENVCHAVCPDCDHRTGCCRHATMAGLTACQDDPATTSSAVGDLQSSRDVDTHAARTGLTTTTTARSGLTTTTTARSGLTTSTTARSGLTTSTTTTARTGLTTTTLTTTTARQGGSTTTEKPSTTAAIVTNNTTTVLPPPPPSPTKRRENGGSFVQTVTTMEVKVYKYDDELMKKLIWISAMTVVGIAMVFVVMFVVFFNCASRAPAGGKRQRPQPTTGAAKVHETYIDTHNIGHIPQDRYTKNPELRTFTNNDLPIHPEILCPVFSAPHYTSKELSLYDSPQPLYEFLC